MRTFETVVDGAGRVFAQVSYRRATMSDIAQEAGVGLATLYRYVESKEELFELALRRGLGMPLDLLWTAVRAQDGFQTEVLSFVRARFAEISALPLLSRAGTCHAPKRVSAEFSAIVGELYDTIDRFRLGIRILDRSTADWPALAKVFATWVRGPAVTLLTRYLERRAREGRIPAPPDARAAARLIVEICATLAMHRHFVSGGNYTSDALARATALHAATRGFGPVRAGGARRARPAGKRWPYATR